MKRKLADTAYIADTIKFNGGNGHEILDTYEKVYDYEAGGFSDSWIKRNSPPFPSTFWIRMNRDVLSPITVQLVSYAVPDYPRIGLERREATSLLREFGLRQPTARECILIASRTLETRHQIFHVMYDESMRSIAALIPFNPEIPTYLRFGLTEKNITSFALEDHCDCGTKGRLYFYELAVTNHYVERVEVVTRHFPLLLGIKE